MREIRLLGSEGRATLIRRPYLYLELARGELTAFLRIHVEHNSSAHLSG